MSGSTGPTLHPIVQAAGGSPGRLPPWARIGPGRREHVERVAALLDEWAAELGLSGADRVRWRAAGRLHDALKAADADSLRPLVPGADGPWPDSLLHGPACAARLRAEGVDDESLLAAVAHHSTGHPALDDLGRYLYLADYLEPGRSADPDLCGALRARLPSDRRAVLREVAARRIGGLLERGLPILPTSIEFWNRLVGEAREARGDGG